MSSLCCLYYRTCHLVSNTLFITPFSYIISYSLSLHDALPISSDSKIDLAHQSSLSTKKIQTRAGTTSLSRRSPASSLTRSEEHTSELQSPCNLVCRLLLEKKKK